MINNTNIFLIYFQLFRMKGNNMVNKMVNKESTTKSKSLFIVYLIIFCTILTPSARLGTLPAFRIEQLIVVLFYVCILIKVLLRKQIKITYNIFPFMYLGFSFFILLSILIGSKNGIKVMPNDFFELYKIIVYLGIFLISYSRIKSLEDKIKIVKFIIICLLLYIIVSVQQYFNLFNLNEKHVHLIAPTLML